MGVLREGSYAFSDFDCLDWALDFAGSAEDAVPFPHGVSFPAVQQRLATVVGGLLVNLLLLGWEVHFVENVDWAYGDADAVSDAYVKVYCNRDTVHTILLANTILPPNLMPFVILFLGPFVRERCVVDNASLSHFLHQTRSGDGDELRIFACHNPT